MRKVYLIGGLGVAWFLAVVVIVVWLFSGSSTPNLPPLAETPPLQPVSRASTVIAPATISVAAVRQAMENAAPRNLQGRKELPPAAALLATGEMSWSIDRGPLAVVGRADALTVTTPLTGAFRAAGQFGGQGARGGQGGQAGLGGALGAIVGGNVGRQLERMQGPFDQKGDIRGTVAVTARPKLTPGWRLEPNLTGAVNLADVSVPIATFRLNVGREVKPFVQGAVDQQIAALEARVRADPFLETTARREWGNLCRAIPLATPGANAPALWLEVKPTRAFAAQPRVDQASVNLVFGVEAQTRVVPTQTKPECPFPARIELVPAIQQGRIAIGVPIDMPFTEANRLINDQLAGKTFGAEAGSAVAVTVKKATLAASGERLLISMQVAATEKRFLGFGADASVHVWGKPQLDAANQILSFTDLAFDVDSEAAFGLLGAAARAAIPYLLPTISEQARIDLKPFAADARRKIEAAVADFRKRTDGVKLDASVTDLRLVGVAFDAKTLRVIAEADGNVNVAVTALPVP